MNMKKSMFAKLTSVTLLSGAAILGSYQADDSKMGNLLLQNIEAIAQSEVTQPNIDDCVKSTEYDCIALHPTDEKKDQVKKNAEWPV